MTIFEHAYYCEMHDQGYLIVTSSEEEPGPLSAKIVCGVEKCKGWHEHYGMREVDENGEIVSDTIRGDDWYERCAGGWKTAYYENEKYQPDGKKICSDCGDDICDQCSKIANIKEILNH